jgi:cytochrome c-type biogenesis protein CcmH/NrfF
MKRSLASILRHAVGTAALAAVAAMPVAAQSTGPSHAGYDPNAPAGVHSHEGELGEKLLVLERALKCSCGCGLDVHSCQFQMQCGTSPGWTQRIRASLEAGESVDAIQASFVADFGTEVLMLPPPEGFNLLGYLLPALAIVTAGMFVGLIARGNATRHEMVTVQELSSDEEERLRAAMQRLDAEESPDW